MEVENDYHARGKRALRNAAVTSNAETEWSGKDAAHESRYRIMPGSRSVVESLSCVSAVSLPQASKGTWCSGLMEKIPLEGNSMSLLSVDCAVFLSLARSSVEVSSLASIDVRLLSSFLAASIHFLLTSFSPRRLVSRYRYV